MKKIIIFFALVTSVVIIGTAHRGLTVSAKSVTAENCLPAITELSKTYSRLNGYSGADWEDILPNIYDAEVTVNGKSAYQFDYETALAHLKEFFTNKTASDLKYRAVSLRRQNVFHEWIRGSTVSNNCFLQRQ